MRTIIKSISILSHIVEFRNGESGSHVIHINKLTDMLLKELVGITDRYDITGDDIELIATASALHDIGKIGIDDAILNKPGRLTDEEFEVMKTHTVLGARMLDDLDAYGESCSKQPGRYAAGIMRDMMVTDIRMA